MKRSRQLGADLAICGCRIRAEGGLSALLPALPLYLSRSLIGSRRRYQNFRPTKLGANVRFRSVADIRRVRPFPRHRKFTRLVWRRPTAIGKQGPVSVDCNAERTVEYLNPEMHRDGRNEPNYAEGWAASSVELLPLRDARISAIVDACAWQKGSVDQFKVTLAPPVDLFVRRNTLHHCSFFRDFLTHPAVSDRLEEPEGTWWRSAEVKPLAPDADFERHGPWVATGYLASQISFRGLTAERSCPDDEVLSLIRDFAEAAFCMRYSGTLAYISRTPWHRWFLGGFDSTYLWFDRHRGIVTLLAISDSS